MSIEGEKNVLKQPEPGEAETVTITLKEYRLLSDVADNVIRMARALEDFKKPQSPMGFQPPSSRPEVSDSEPQS
jgi:hypothetical protein